MQFLHQRLHHGEVVIDVLEEHGLVAQWNAGIGEPAKRFAHFRREFARVVGVDADEERMELLQHGAQLGRDALRQEDGNARADAKELDVRNRAQTGQQILQLLVAEQKRIEIGRAHV